MQIPETHWIWLPEYTEQLDGEPVVALFRREFALKEIPASKRISISADTRYKLYVNGTLVEFGPARGDNRIWYRDEIDLAPFLAVGVNVLAVEVLRYPVAYRSGNFGMFRTPTPGLFVEELGEDGIGISADRNWLCTRKEGISIHAEAPGYAPLFYLENVVSRSELDGWMLSGYVADGWKESATVYGISDLRGILPGGSA